MRRNNRELWLAVFAMLVITLLYFLVAYVFKAVPSASGFFGHALGVLGFILMLLTETLYSWRKRSRRARWGKMSSWLRFHIFTGLVGPYMVLLHTSWKFNGLAGIVSLFTLIIVISGVIGRYIYTAIPRTPEGIEIQDQQLSRYIQELEKQIKQLLETGDPGLHKLVSRLDLPPRKSSSSLLRFPGNILTGWKERRLWKVEKHRLSPGSRIQAARLQELITTRNRLRRQVDNVASARRLLSLWHTVHIPLGMALFALAVVHIGGALYYATLLR